jgi:phosphopentomutase
MYGKNIKGGVNLGTRPTFADIATTILDYFGLKDGEIAGTSMLEEISK